MDLKMLSKLINDLSHDDNTNEIRVQFRYDLMVYDVIIDGQYIVVNDENDEHKLEHDIYNALLTGVEKIFKTRYENGYSPKIDGIHISRSFIDYCVMDVVVDLGKVNFLGREAIVL